MIPEDIRTLTLMDWLENDLLLTIQDIGAASSDASFRRYFRVATPEGSYIVMDAPPDKENIQPFIKVASLLAVADVNTPTIYQQNLTDGFLLLEDFGSENFLDKLDSETADRLYESALASLLKLQLHHANPETNLPTYDEALLNRELGIFSEWFVDNLLGLEMPGLWRDVQAILVESALAQPTVIVHRDYHSRNLMVLNDNSPGVIDFQDAVIGPITYDLVSLLRDCYIAWPEARVSGWLNGYFAKLRQAGLLACGLSEFERWFDLMGMQRHLKAIGIFARLHLRDGKSGYLQDIPRTFNYIMTVCQRYPELRPFQQFLNQQIAPRLTADAWQQELASL